MSRKNIFTLILIFVSITDHDNIIAGNKYSSMLNDFATNVENLSYQEISVVAVAAGLSMYAGYYAGQTLRNQSGVDDEMNEESEGSECLFRFDDHAFGKLSEDENQDSLPDLEVLSEYDELDDLYEWTNAMKIQELDSPKSCRVIPPVRSFHNKNENDEKKSLCQTIKPFAQ